MPMSPADKQRRYRERKKREREEVPKPAGEPAVESGPSDTSPSGGPDISEEQEPAAPSPVLGDVTAATGLGENVPVASTPANEPLPVKVESTGEARELSTAIARVHERQTPRKKPRKKDQPPPAPSPEKCPIPHQVGVKCKFCGGIGKPW